MSAGSHKGYDTWKKDWSLRRQMFWSLCWMFFKIQVLGGFVAVVLHEWPRIPELFGHAWDVFVKDGKPQEQIMFGNPKVIWTTFVGGFKWSAPVWFGLPVAYLFFRWRGQRDAEIRHLSGTDVVPLERIRRKMEKKPSLVSVQTAKRLPKGIRNVDHLKMLKAAPLQISDEIMERHLFVIGASGSGKSATISQFVEKIVQGGYLGIVHDTDCEYVTRFYNPDRDIIFNPLDARSPGWTIFNDLSTDADYRLVSQLLIPESKNSDPIWSTGTRHILEAIIGAVAESEEHPSNQRLWEVIESGPVKIARFLRKYPQWKFAAESYFEDPSSKMALSFTATLTAWANPIKYLPDGEFSIKDLFERDGGLVFLTNRENLKPMLKPLLSLFLELFGVHALSLDVDLKRRFYMLIDEMGALHRVGSVERLPVQIRKRGGVLILGVQDFGQLDEIYGQTVRKSITNSCGSSFIFSVADEDTAEALSKRIGEREITEATESVAGGAMDTKEGFSLSRRRHVERAVLPSHLMGMPPLQCFVRLSGESIAQAQIIPVDYPQVAKSFVEREARVVKAVEEMAETQTDDEDRQDDGRPSQLGLEDFM